MIWLVYLILRSLWLTYCAAHTKNAAFALCSGTERTRIVPSENVCNNRARANLCNKCAMLQCSKKMLRSRNVLFSVCSFPVCSVLGLFRSLFVLSSEVATVYKRSIKTKYVIEVKKRSTNTTLVSHPPTEC